jgi:hypothetical protein
MESLIFQSRKSFEMFYAGGVYLHQPGEDEQLVKTWQRLDHITATHMIN